LTENQLVVPSGFVYIRCLVVFNLDSLQFAILSQFGLVEELRHHGSSKPGLVAARILESGSVCEPGLFTSPFTPSSAAVDSTTTTTAAFGD
jgi:hypothetical protein